LAALGAQPVGSDSLTPQAGQPGWFSSTSRPPRAGEPVGVCLLTARLKAQ